MEKGPQQIPCKDFFFYLLGVENFFSLGIKPKPSAFAYGHGDSQEMTVTNPQVNRLAH